ncbi:putative O-glycosylation ligase, exosortase A system-associated [Falsiroseomonas selenitidurans]|uniref:O-glycosylation ligase, exosortase A system-associated n=1 Tax=Falsiroseomonas selenitidurans TaxID=2716335 RepID=A0ABX1E1J2_9PROT|nr:putative O-glycosylation ligase, exosortase A system-associated [Falsiroseomonas selenitidurans]NKC30555.1 putative O-glycosylation ligase, exosortase A system-associated [Falsiroseomonas selenitidurans]
MRDAVFMATMAGLLPLALFRPFVGVLLWCWIAFLNPHRLVYGFTTAIPWAMVVFAVALAGLVLSGELRRARFNGVMLMLVVFLACITVTSLTALGDPVAVWAKYSAVSKVLLGLLLTGALLTDRWRIHALIWVMVLSIGYFGVRGGIFAIITGGNYRIWGPQQTMIEDNNHLAAAMLVTLPLMNYLRLQSRHALVRTGLAAAMALTLLSTVATYSRGALLGLVAVTLTLWWRSRRKLVSAAVLAVAVAGAITFMPPQWAQRMETLRTYQEDESASQRLMLWGVAFRLALDRPMLGTGFTGTYTRSVVDRVAPEAPARAIHSIWFELLAEQGFPTFFVWCGIILAGAWYAQALVRRARGSSALRWAHDLGRMAQVSLVAYLVSGTFLSLSYWDFLWTLLVVIGAAHLLVRQESAAAAPVRPWADTRPRWRPA